MARVLIVDDEKSIRLTLGAFVSREGHSVSLAANSREALALFQHQSFDVVVCDVILPHRSGLNLMSEMRRMHPDVRVILITGQPEVGAALDALRLGAFDYLEKPVSRADIVNAVAAASRSTETQSTRQAEEETSQGYQDKLSAQAAKQIAWLRETQRMSAEFSRHDVLIKQLAKALGRSADLPLLYRIVHEHVMRVMDTAMFIISSYDQEARLIRAVYVINEGAEMEAELLPSIPLAREGRGRQSQVIRTGQPLVMVDKLKTQEASDTEYTISSSGEVKPGIAVEGEDVVHSAIFVPMGIGKETIGVIQVQSHRRDAYSEEDVSLLQAMASMAAVAIENVRRRQTRDR